MAVGISVIPSRPVVIAVGSSTSDRRILLHGRELKNVWRVLPTWERRQRKSTTCSWSTNTSSDTDVKAPGLTLYELLGISRQVGLPEIKMAYREKARRYHPDANPPSKKDECTKKFLLVQEAYEVLADPDLRADYDYRLRQPLSMQALASGFSYKRRSRSRDGSPRVDDEVVVNKQSWRSQWEAQVEGLKRDAGRKKAGSWAARMQQKRQEAAQEHTSDSH